MGSTTTATTGSGGEGGMGTGGGAGTGGAGGMEEPAFLDITFDDAAVTYTLTGFGGDEGSSVVTDPTDAASSSESTATTGAVDSSGGVDDTGASSEGSSSGAVEASPECMTYCAEFIPNCSAIPDVEVYDDETDCLQTCEGFVHGPEGEFSGDTVECRVAHLTFDPMPGPGYYELHCFHAQEHPTSQCV